MADFDEEEDIALRVFGTPERELRRRWLRPLGYPVSPGEEEQEEEIDSNQQQSVEQPSDVPVQVRTIQSTKTSAAHKTHCFPLPAPVKQDKKDEDFPPSPEPLLYTPTTVDRFVALLFHLCAAFFFVYMKLETDSVLDRIKQEKGLIMPGSDNYGGRLKFLTFLNFVSPEFCIFLHLTLSLPSPSFPLSMSRSCTLFWRCCATCCRSDRRSCKGFATSSSPLSSYPVLW